MSYKEYSRTQLTQGFFPSTQACHPLHPTCYRSPPRRNNELFHCHHDPQALGSPTASPLPPAPRSLHTPGSRKAETLRAAPSAPGRQRKAPGSAVRHCAAGSALAFPLGSAADTSPWNAVRAGGALWAAFFGQKRRVSMLVFRGGREDRCFFVVVSLELLSRVSLRQGCNDVPGNKYPKESFLKARP